MDFKCESENLFHIEKSELYATLSNVKTVEFLLLRNRTPEEVWLVEAKSSAPNPKNKIDFDKYKNDIFDKITCSLAFYFSLHLGRFKTAPQCLPKKFQQLDIAAVNFKFIVIIRRQEKNWIKDLQDALLPMFTKIANSYNLKAPYLAVLNAEMAKQRDIISRHI